MKKAIHDCITGEVTIIDMPDEEKSKMEEDWEQGKIQSNKKTALEILMERVETLEKEMRAGT